MLTIKRKKERKKNVGLCVASLFIGIENNSNKKKSMNYVDMLCLFHVQSIVLERVEHELDGGDRCRSSDSRFAVFLVVVLNGDVDGDCDRDRW